MLNAIHESGHASAAILMGGMFDHVEVNAALFNNGNDGGLHGPHICGETPFDFLTIAAAGPIAQFKAMFGIHTNWDLGEIGDFSKLWIHADTVDISRIISRTSRIVDDHWKTIQSLAERLSQEGEIGYDECLEIVNS